MGRLTHPNVHRKIMVLFDHILLRDEELMYNLGAYLNKKQPNKSMIFLLTLESISLLFMIFPQFYHQPDSC